MGLTVFLQNKCSKKMFDHTLETIVTRCLDSRGLLPDAGIACFTSVFGDIMKSRNGEIKLIVKPNMAINIDRFSF